MHRSVGALRTLATLAGEEPSALQTMFDEHLQSLTRFLGTFAEPQVRSKSFSAAAAKGRNNTNGLARLSERGCARPSLGPDATHRPHDSPSSRPPGPAGLCATATDDTSAERPAPAMREKQGYPITALGVLLAREPVAQSPVCAGTPAAGRTGVRDAYAVPGILDSVGTPERRSRTGAGPVFAGMAGPARGR
jgi:hypothetical protein